MATETLTVADVAKLLKVPKARVYELIRRGALPSIHVGRQVRIIEMEYEHWLAQGGFRLAGGWRDAVAD